MLVKMLTLAASPEAILHVGLVYNLPRAKAIEFVKAGAAKAAGPGEKVQRIPPQPDPEDVPEPPEDDEVTEEEDEE